MRFSMSRAELALRCSWPFAAGRELSATAGDSPIYPLYGQAFHDTVSHVINDGEFDVVASVKALQIPGDLNEHVGAIMRMFPWDHALEIQKSNPLARAEVALAYDPKARSCRFLGENIGREYDAHGLLPHEIPGSIDVVWVEQGSWDNSDDIVVVHDWKIVFGGSGHLAMPEDNAQLHSLALAAMRWKGVNKARVQLRVINGLTGESFIRTADITLLQAMMTFVRVTKMLDVADTCDPIPGRHCTELRCPMLASCPAIQSVVNEAYKLSDHPTSAGMPIVASSKKITSDAHAAYLITVAKQLKSVSEKMSNACKEYVTNKGAPIDTGPDTEWGPVRQTRTVVLSPSVSELAHIISQFVGGEGNARKIVMAGVTKDALQREVANHSPKGSATTNFKLCMENLGAAGFIRLLPDGEVFREHKKGS